MQFLWKWIDEIAGKDVGLFFILEMLGYMSVSLIPMALPIAVLISSVMVMGNLSERYELSSLKSAGVSLTRVMFPLMILTFLISVFSFFCSDQLIPITNLKYQSRLYDIKNQKPALSLDEGVFNDDFQGYSIRIGRKLSDDKSIEDVLMYDHKTASDKYFLITAERGEMFVTKDERFFVLKLYDGNQYMETKPTFKDGKPNKPFVRTAFVEFTKVFDLSEFVIERTDENAFKDHYNMLTIGQLIEAVDSIDRKQANKIADMGQSIDRVFHFRNQRKLETVKEKEDTDDSPSSLQVSNNTVIKEKMPKKRASTRRNKYNTPDQLEDLEPLESYESILYTFDKKDRNGIVSKAMGYASSVSQGIRSTTSHLRRTDETRMKNVYAAHNKLSTAVACFIFLFIGAPMGAIIRKGGFGYPLIVAVGFFVSYIVLTILFKKSMEGGSIGPTLAAWLPCAIILPIGMGLTYFAMKDLKSFNAIWSYFSVKGLFASRKVKVQT